MMSRVQADVAQPGGRDRSPAAWITTVAKRIAVDTVRRDATLRAKLPLLAEPQPGSLPNSHSDVPPPSSPDLESPGGDDRLGLLFAVSTPALTPESRLALALRFVCGLPTQEIAAVMLVAHTAMSARITRANSRSSATASASLRLTRSNRATDSTMCSVRCTPCTRSVTRRRRAKASAHATSSIPPSNSPRHSGVLAPDDREVAGLEALLVLTDARSAGRLDASGRVVPLDRVDRSLWDVGRIRVGLNLASFALPGGGRYALEAGISGLHSQARTGSRPTGPRFALSTTGLWLGGRHRRWRSRGSSPAAIRPRGASARSRSWTSYHHCRGRSIGKSSPRADILRRMGRAHEARAAYMLARSLEGNGPIREYFDSRIDELGRFDGFRERDERNARDRLSEGD